MHRYLVCAIRKLIHIEDVTKITQRKVRPYIDCYVRVHTVEPL